MDISPIRLNPNYHLLPKFPDFQIATTEYGPKLLQLAEEIGNCLLKVGAKPAKIYLRKLKKFFIKTNWFKKVRIIRNQLFLFRKRGRFAIRLTPSSIYQLKALARERKLAKQ